MLDRELSAPRRPSKRVITASVAAVALALSASLYPIPSDSRLLELFPPKDQSTQAKSSTPLLLELMQHDEVGDEGGEAYSDVLHSELAALLGGDPAVAAAIAEIPTEDLNEFIEAHGVPKLVLALTTLMATTPLLGGEGGGRGGGGGAIAPTLDLTQGLVVALQTLLEFMSRELPALFDAGSPALVVMVWPAVLRALDDLVTETAALAETAPTAAVAGDTPESAAAAAAAPPSADPPATPPPDSGPLPETTRTFAVTEETKSLQEPAFSPTATPEMLSEEPSFASPQPTVEPKADSGGSSPEEIVVEEPAGQEEEPTPSHTDEPDPKDTSTAEPDPPKETADNDPGGDDPPTDNDNDTDNNNNNNDKPSDAE